MTKATPIRVGLVGIGRAGWGMHTQELASRADKFTFVAACDPDPARRQQMSQKFGCRTYARIADLIADPEVELVDIASRSPEHVPHALAALKAGKYVYLEKPIALSPALAAKLQAAATRGPGKGRLFIRHNRRFEPAFVHIREIIAAGVLGRIIEIKLRRHGYQRRDDWQAIVRTGGGQLLNWGPHIIDHALQLLEAPVADVWSDLQRVTAVGDAEDHVHIIVRGTNGRVVDLEISGGSALPEPNYHIIGDRGALTCHENKIHLRHLNPKQKLARRKASPASPPNSGAFGTPEKFDWVDQHIAVNPKGLAGMTVLWDCLFDSIRGGKTFPIKLNEAMEVVRLTHRARRGTRYPAPA